MSDRAAEPPQVHEMVRTKANMATAVATRRMFDDPGHRSTDVLVEPRQSGEHAEAANCPLHGAESEDDDAEDPGVGVPGDRVGQHTERQRRERDPPPKRPECVASAHLAQSMNLARCSGDGMGQLS